MEDAKNMEKEVPPVGRLQSFKVRRDLSLGNSKAKKQYAPNLNVVRNKDKNKEFLRKAEQKRKEKTNNRTKHEKLGDKQRYLQSAGVFSQGSGEVKRVSSYGDRVTVREGGGGGGGGGTGGGGGGGASAGGITQPTIKKEEWKVNKKAEDVVLDELVNFDIDSDEEEMSFSPLTLATDPIKSNKVIKKEESEDINQYLTGTIPEPFSRDDCTEENPALALVKLPDSFAGKGLSDDPSVKKLFDYPLSGMLEGQIGKLVIRKSGKMEVVIGRIRYELSPDQTFDSKEELATISKDDSGESSIAILGNVLNNFVMFPDYDALLGKQ